MNTNYTFKDTFTLSQKLTVYIPATTDVNKKIDNTVYVDKCAAMLSEYFGGATSCAALGYWMSPEYGLVKEATTQVFAYCADEALRDHIQDVINFCENLKVELSQECIALELNNEMHFI